MEKLRRLGVFSSNGLVVADPAYEPGEGLGVTLPNASGEWEVWVSAADRGPTRRLEARSGPVGAWTLVEPSLTTDTGEVGIYDARFYVRERALVRGAGAGDRLLRGGAQASGCYDPWRCAVFVSVAAGQVVGVRVVWYSAALPDRDWTFGAKDRWRLARLRAARLTLFGAEEVREVNLLDVYREGEALLRAAGVPAGLVEELRPLLRAHGMRGER